MVSEASSICPIGFAGTSDITHLTNFLHIFVVKIDHKITHMFCGNYSFFLRLINGKRNLLGLERPLKELGHPAVECQRKLYNSSTYILTFTLLLSVFYDEKVFFFFILWYERIPWFSSFIAVADDTRFEIPKLVV